jgi:hypothetical protein
MTNQLLIPFFRFMDATQPLGTKFVTVGFVYAVQTRDKMNNSV